MSNINNSLSFVESGSGNTALVFLHYFGGSSHTWFHVIKELKNEFRCIAIDLCGFGHSPEPPKNFSINDNAKSVADLITTFHLKKFVLIGHSMGGKIALLLASLKPYGLKKLVLIAPSPPTPELMTDKEQEQLLNAYNNRSALTENINSITKQPLTDVDINKLVNDNLRASKISWRSWIKHGSQEDISGEVQGINVPVLVISGQYDKKLSSKFLNDEFVNTFTLYTLKK